MMSYKILHIDTSIRDNKSSYSRHMGEFFINKLKAKDAETTIIYQDLAKAPIPYLTEEFSDAASTPLAMRSNEQNKLLQTADMSGLVNADIYVVDLAGYMFDMPATFKSFIEHMAQFDITIGADWSPILQNKKMLVIAAWGYTYNSIAPEIGYEFIIKKAFGELGVKDITFFNIFNTSEITATADDVEKEIEKYIAAL